MGNPLEELRKKLKDKRNIACTVFGQHIFDLTTLTCNVCGMTQERIAKDEKKNRKQKL